MKIKKEELNLLNDTMKILLENEFYVKFPSQMTLNRCSGWVNHNPKQFTVCFPKQTKNVDYESTWGVFIHESCHLDQAIEKSPLWFNSIIDACDRDPITEFCIRKTIGKSKKIKKYFKAMLELELDCERRSVEKIKKYNLNIDINDYIKRGNVYLKSYYSFYNLQIWYDKEFRIYDQDDIINQMPENFEESIDSYWKKCKPIHDFLKIHGV